MDLASAAKRHKRCAEHLSAAREQGEACYLLGLAAECALKAHLQQTGFPLIRQNRARKKQSAGPDPLYLHFPDLAVELLAQGEGILTGRILEQVANPALFQGWTVKMRYRGQPSAPIEKKQYDRWLAQASAIFVETGI